MRVQFYAKLQLLDQRLAAVAARRSVVADQLREGEAVQELYKLRHERSSQLKYERGRASDLHWELEEIELRLRTLSAQNQEGPSDPLVARELALLRDTRDQLEDQALLQMERVAQIEREFVEVDGAWQRQRAEWAEREPVLRAEWERLTGALEALQNERQLVAARLVPDARALYDDLQRRHRGTAIAPIRNRQCSVCHARLPAAVFDLLAGADPLVRCPRCGRVLVGQTDEGDLLPHDSRVDLEHPDASS